MAVATVGWVATAAVHRRATGGNDQTLPTPRSLLPEPKRTPRSRPAPGTENTLSHSNSQKSSPLASHQRGVATADSTHRALNGRPADRTLGGSERPGTPAASQRLGNYLHLDTDSVVGGLSACVTSCEYAVMLGCSEGNHRVVDRASGNAEAGEDIGQVL